MTSFFDQLDRQLREVATRGQAVTSRRPRRLAAVALAAVSVGGTALAATGLWRPILGEPGLGRPPSITASAPPRGQLALLGVLRRPQTPTDRSAETREELRYMSNTAAGVRTAYIRLLSGDTGLGPAILVPVARITRSLLGAPPAVVARTPRTNALCLLVGDRSGEGSAKQCFTTTAVLDGRATLSVGDLLFGLVPDRVRRVTVRFSSGTTTSSIPSSNFFRISMPAGAIPVAMSWALTAGPPRHFPL